MAFEAVGDVGDRGPLSVQYACKDKTSAIPRNLTISLATLSDSSDIASARTMNNS